MVRLHAFWFAEKTPQPQVVRESLAVTPKTGEALPKHRSNEYGLV